MCPPPQLIRFWWRFGHVSWIPPTNLRQRSLLFSYPSALFCRHIVYHRLGRRILAHHGQGTFSVRSESEVGCGIKCVGMVCSFGLTSCNSWAIHQGQFSRTLSARLARELGDPLNYSAIR